MTEMDDKILNASRAFRDENFKMAKTVAASQGSKRIVEDAQVRSSEDLHKFVEQYKADQKEQAKESRFNKRLAIGSIIVAVISAIFGGASLVVSVIALRG